MKITMIDLVQILGVEDAELLARFAADTGNNWRHRLAILWATGKDDSPYNYETYKGALRRIRNKGIDLKAIVL